VQIGIGISRSVRSAAGLVLVAGGRRYASAADQCRSGCESQEIGLIFFSRLHEDRRCRTATGWVRSNFFDGGREQNSLVASRHVGKAERLSAVVCVITTASMRRMAARRTRRPSRSRLQHIGTEQAPEHD
jgi:hypothetical protein